METNSLYFIRLEHLLSKPPTKLDSGKVKTRIRFPMSHHRPSIGKVWTIGLAFLLYLILSIVVTWPLLPRIGTTLSGGSTDAMLHYWNGWWVLQAIQEGTSPYSTNLLFHPIGVSLAYQNFAWLSILPWLVLQSVVDGIVSYNLVILLNLALSGFAAYLLTNELTGNHLAAFVAGLIYLSWPFRLSQLDHPNLISTQWIPFFLLSLIWAIRYRQIRYGLLAGLCLALVGYTRWQLLIPAVVMGGIYLLFNLPKQLELSDISKPLIAGFAFSVLLLIPAVVLLASQQAIPQASIDDILREGEESIMQTDLLAYFTPSGDHPVFGPVTKPIYDEIYQVRSASRRFPAYVGLTSLALAGLGIWYARRDALPWLIMGVVLIFLAAGHEWRLNGRVFGNVPTLYRLLEPLVVFRLLRVPDRYNLFLALPFAVLAAYGLSYLFGRVAQYGRIVSLTFAIFFGVLILFEYLSIPIDQQEIQLTQFNEILMNDPNSAAILDLPIDPIKAKQNMFAQTIHQRPIMFGHISREPLGAYEYIDENPLLRVLRQSNEMPPWLTDVGEQLATLATDDVEFIVMHKDQIGADRIEHWKRYLPIEPVFEDNTIAAFSTSPEAEDDFSVISELAPGIGPVRVITSTDCVEVGDVFEVDVAWASTRPVEHNYQVVFTLEDDQDSIKDDRLLMAEELSSSGWGENSLVWAYYAANLDPDIPAGEYQLEMTLQGDQDENGSTTFPIGSLVVTKSDCDFKMPPETIPVDAVFGEQLRLIGYRLSRPDPDFLEVTLYWRAEQRIPIDYKVFVHVFEEDSAIPVAQDDSIPHRGGYSTNFWAPGEDITDHIPIYLGDAPAGRYGVAIGVYDPATDERLPVVDRDGSEPQDRRLVLPGENVEVGK